MQRSLFLFIIYQSDNSLRVSLHLLPIKAVPEYSNPYQYKYQFSGWFYVYFPHHFIDQRPKPSTGTTNSDTRTTPQNPLLFSATSSEIGDSCPKRAVVVVRSAPTGPDGKPSNTPTLLEAVLTDIQLSLNSLNVSNLSEFVEDGSTADGAAVALRLANVTLSITVSLVIDFSF